MQNLNVRGYSVSAGSTLELYNTGASIDYIYFSTNASITGSGTLLKTGPGCIDFYQGSIMNFTGLIDVQGGLFGNNVSDWTNSACRMDLNVASGAYFDLRNGTGNQVVINRLSGSGTIGTTYSGTGKILTVGNNNGSSTFDGVIMNTITGSPFGNIASGGTVGLTKTGTGTLTLTGTSTYTGATTVSQRHPPG